MMGCFPVLKSKKKKPEPSVSIKRITPKEQIPTILPEPKIPMRSLQSAPPSFITRVKPVQPENRVVSNRARALSAPESLDAAEQDALAAVEYDEQEEPRNRVGLAKEQRSRSPQPLPLPSPQSTATLKPVNSLKLVNVSGPLNPSGPLPLPPTGPHSGALRNFSYDEIASACRNFSSDLCQSEGLSSVIYRASFGDDNSGIKKFEANVTRLHSSTQVKHGFSFGSCMQEVIKNILLYCSLSMIFGGYNVLMDLLATTSLKVLLCHNCLSDEIIAYCFHQGCAIVSLYILFQGLKDFINEVSTLASLRHPNLCKLLGYHARDGSQQRILVYERLYHGSLDRLLYGRTDGPPIDWNTRMKIALCAAQGLTFLHEEGPFQVFSTMVSSRHGEI